MQGTMRGDYVGCGVGEEWEREAGNCYDQDTWYKCMILPNNK